MMWVVELIIMEKAMAKAIPLLWLWSSQPRPSQSLTKKMLFDLKTFAAMSQSLMMMMKCCVVERY